MMNWAEYEEEETPAERCFWKEAGCALLIGIALAGILASLGCASSPSPRSEPRVEVCYLRLLGHTEDGMSVVVASTCYTPKDFAEAQK